MSVLLGNGNGSFRTQQTFATDQRPVQTVVADLNGDGRPDLVTVNNHDSATGVLLGNGDGTFQPVTAASGVGVSIRPFWWTLTATAFADSIVLDRSGNILYRQGLAGADDAFAPPVILNPGPARARHHDRANPGIGLAIAAADAHYDPTLSTNQFVFTVSLYTVQRRTATSAAAWPSRRRHCRSDITAADLTGNGLDDLIVANSLNNSVTIALQTTTGKFAATDRAPVGITPSDIAVGDVNGDGLPDIIVTDQSSGDVTVLLNDPSHPFSQALRFRCRHGPDTAGCDRQLRQVEFCSTQISQRGRGDFTGNGRTDLVVVNAGAHSFSVSAQRRQRRFSDPPLALTTSTSDGSTINDSPGAVVAGDFNRDGKLDLAVLMQDTGQVWIYTNNGDGTFLHTFSIPVGDEATGLSVVPGSGPGLLDLLVGNGFGDVLHLAGKGDGTFQISGNKVSLSVVPNLLGPGQAGVLVGNQQNNSVTVQTPSSGGSKLTTVQKLAGAGPTAQLRAGRRSMVPARQRIEPARCGGGEQRQQRRIGLPNHGGQQWRDLVCSNSANLFRWHQPGKRYRGRHQRRWRAGHACRQPG